jgi:hypothetical protein
MIRNHFHLAVTAKTRIPAAPRMIGPGGTFGNPGTPARYSIRIPSAAMIKPVACSLVAKDTLFSIFFPFTFSTFFAPFLMHVLVGFVLHSAYGLKTEFTNVTKRMLP